MTEKGIPSSVDGKCRGVHLLSRNSLVCAALFDGLIPDIATIERPCANSTPWFVRSLLLVVCFSSSRRVYVCVSPSFQSTDTDGRRFGQLHRLATNRLLYGFVYCICHGRRSTASERANEEGANGPNIAFRRRSKHISSCTNAGVNSQKFLS